MFGIFGKKAKKAAIQEAPYIGIGGFVVDPNFVKVCRLLNYRTTTEMREVTYYFISKNFCCTICWDGVIYGETGYCEETGTHLPYASRNIVRPADIRGLSTDGISINDNGLDMMYVCLTGENGTELCHICIPVSDFEKFNAAVQQCITDDEDIRACYGDEVYTYSGSFGPMPLPAAAPAQRSYSNNYTDYSWCPPQEEEAFCSNPIKAADMERIEWEARSRGYMDANDWARSQSGWDNASDAYNYGWFGGKC